MSNITIHNHPIGAGSPVFIIAEVGVNHNGSKDLALEMVRAAKEAGADCVKLQTFKAERVVTQSAPKAKYQLFTTSRSETQFEMLKKLELSTDSYGEIRDLSGTLGIVFTSTPYSTEDTDFLEELGVPAFKIASGQVVEHTFLEHVAKKGKPVILSTGMATLSEVDEAVRVIKGTGNHQLILLQCTTNYPAQLETVNLLAMQTMKSAFGFPVGFSDHTETPLAAIAAVALGASVIEKHFTLDRTMPGPDQVASADPKQFREYVQSIRKTELALGSPIKEPNPIELENAIGMRRSIVAKRRIEAGEKISEDLVTFKRPGTGISPSKLDSIIGWKARAPIALDELISWEKISPSGN